MKQKERFEGWYLGYHPFSLLSTWTVFEGSAMQQLQVVSPIQGGPDAKIPSRTVRLAEAPRLEITPTPVCSTPRQQMQGFPEMLCRSRSEQAHCHRQSVKMGGVPVARYFPVLPNMSGSEQVTCCATSLPLEVWCDYSWSGASTLLYRTLSRPLTPLLGRSILYTGDAREGNVKHLRTPEGRIA